MHTYGRKPVLFTRGDGMRLFDDGGREYLDFVAGIGTINVGHSHPAVVAAICEQVVKLTHVTNLYYVEHRAELASDLVTLFGGGAKVFLCNSGTEATEGAIKLARKWATANRPSEARGIVTAWRSFHGRTLAALAATGQPGKQESFKPLPGGFAHVALNDIEALDLALDDTACALMLEPVQGEGGVYPCDPEYLAAARALCDERNILLIFDEVQCGLYRTGPAFAHQAYKVRPDIMTLAKALANGLPAGAIVATDMVAEAFGPGDHGSTFAGGPVVCAAARATLSALEAERLGTNATEMGLYLRDGLTALAEESGAITEVRGAGLMVAAEISEPLAADIVAAGLESGFVLNNTGTNTMRFLPPLVCTKTEIDTLLDFLHTQLIGGAV
ncbi:MAG: aspartate aminotransferase family protein [Actinobacteria bacterium HGW-Actinobacteria-10]|nr:MAG: aspartate aminotransferase family protein [Actinobacteria bacterium HGW-Actinobacteria-10]